MLVNNFSWKIGGEAGFGIKSSGALFAKAMLRLGLFVFTYDEYPSLIRGGHNAFEAAVSAEPIGAPQRPISILICLDQKTLDAHKHELAADAAIIYDSSIVSIPEALVPKSVILCNLPLVDIIDKVGGEKIMSNTVALGASFALLDISKDFLKQLIEQSFDSKDPKMIVINSKAAIEGYDFAHAKYTRDFNYRVKPQKKTECVLMTGNEAIAWGAISAGCKLYSGYPMTPSTAILHTLAAQADKYNIVFKQAEDEISAINTVIGAGYAGVRAMTATSGGGFSLMSEAYGMAAMMEAPVVIVESMRPGPSTGMPTWSGQGDLQFVLNASQDEFPRIVLVPGDADQSFKFIQVAFNLAEQFQTPVIVINDKHLAECYHTIEVSSLKHLPINRGSLTSEAALLKMKEYRRYESSDNGVSLRSLPGMKGGVHIANTDEHDELGFSSEKAEERVLMMDKRYKKLNSVEKLVPAPIIEGDSRPEITCLAWGSTRGVIIEAMKVLRNQGIKINFIQLTTVSPFPSAFVRDAVMNSKKVAVIENNKTGQLSSLIKQQTGLDPHYKILKYDGRPFFTEELVNTLKELT